MEHLVDYQTGGIEDLPCFGGKLQLARAHLVPHEFSCLSSLSKKFHHYFGDEFKVEFARRPLPDVRPWILMERITGRLQFCVVVKIAFPPGVGERLQRPRRQILFMVFPRRHRLTCCPRREFDFEFGHQSSDGTFGETRQAGNSWEPDGPRQLEFPPNREVFDPPVDNRHDAPSHGHSAHRDGPCETETARGCRVARETRSHPACNECMAQFLSASTMERSRRS